MSTHETKPGEFIAAQLRAERAALLASLKSAAKALEIYAMTSETFPEYGDVARTELAKLKEQYPEVFDA